tara:strand:+ start:324 stop:1046 length:723 start_codon:yes stop_codon:yes gene_type:complete
MKKTFYTKKLLKEWNNFLIKESTADRVKRMIDDLEKFGSKIVIKEIDANSISIKYITKDSLKGKINCRSSKGVHLGDAKTKGIGNGEVNSTWYVTLTSHTTEGMGPLLYETLIEYIGDRKNAALKPDPRSVSDEAKAVWEKFDQRPDIRNIQLDIDDDTVYSARSYGANIEQLTPDHKLDDTAQHSAIYDKGDDDWHTSSLSRAYRKDNTDLIDDLKSRGLIKMPDAPKVYKNKLGSAWS